MNAILPHACKEERGEAGARLRRGAIAWKLPTFREVVMPVAYASGGALQAACKRQLPNEGGRLFGCLVGCSGLGWFWVVSRSRT